MEQKEPLKAYDLVIEYIKAEILHGRLRPGQKLPPERSLAETLGVGRNSVREALRTLEMIGAISSTQGSGNYVSSNFQKSLTEAMSMMFLMQRLDYRQLSELRRGVETQAILLASERITPEQLLQLEETVSQMRLGRDERKNAALDKSLHLGIALASGNHLILLVLQALSEMVDVFISDLRGKILSREKGGPRLQTIHEQMVECLKRRDPAGAREAMQEHFRIIDANMEDFLEHREQRPE